MMHISMRIMSPMYKYVVEEYSYCYNHHKHCKHVPISIFHYYLSGRSSVTFEEPYAYAATWYSVK